MFNVDRQPSVGNILWHSESKSALTWSKITLMVYLFYNKWLLRLLAVLSGLGVGLASWYYIALSVEKIPEQGLRDAAAIISFLIAGWLVMLIAEVIDHHYVRALGCLCLGLGAYISFHWVFRVDGPKLVELPDGASRMALVKLGFWGAVGCAALMLVLLLARLVIDRLNYGRRPAYVARADVSLGIRPEGMGVAPPPEALPQIPIDTSPLQITPGDSQPVSPPRSAAPVSSMVGIGGVYLGTRYALAAGEHSIGRQDADILLTNDMQVSRHHAVLRVAEDGIATLADVGSTNGCFVNDMRVSEMQLAPGDVIRIGTSLFKVEA